jgi:hypothetical protein
MSLRKTRVLARVLPFGQYNFAEFDSAGATLHFIAEGDSWFSLSELPLFSVPPTGSMLHQLPFDSDAWILQLATPGDEIIKMSDWTRNTAFANVLKQGFGPKVDAIFLSGGGNDLFTALAQGFILQAPAPQANLDDPAAYVNASDFARLAQYVQTSYHVIVQRRDMPGNACCDVPVFVHTYDVPIPRNAPATILLGQPVGPWLLTAFKRFGAAIPQPMQLPITRYVLGLLRDTLMQLDSEQGDAAMRLPHFHVIDTIGTLTPWQEGMAAQDCHWVNEIHPSRRGYALVGEKFAQSVRSMLT